MLNNQIIISALLFSITLNFKHIFLYFSPAYFVYILKNYVFEDISNINKYIKNNNNYSNVNNKFLSYKNGKTEQSLCF